MSMAKYGKAGCCTVNAASPQPVTTSVMSATAINTSVADEVREFGVVASSLLSVTQFSGPLAVLQAWWGFESPPDHSGLPVTSWYALKTVIKGRRLLAHA